MLLRKRVEWGLKRINRWIKEASVSFVSIKNSSIQHWSIFSLSFTFFSFLIAACTLSVSWCSSYRGCGGTFDFFLSYNSYKKIRHLKIFCKVFNCGGKMVANQHICKHILSHFPFNGSFCVFRQINRGIDFRRLIKEIWNPNSVVKFRFDVVGRIQLSLVNVYKMFRS